MPIDPNTPYVVIDTVTARVVYRTTYAQRSKARAFADARDAEYGAIRHVCRAANATPNELRQRCGFMRPDSTSTRPSDY